MPAYFPDPVVGPVGVEAPENDPGGRYAIPMWEAEDGKLWIYTGVEIWRFRPL